MQLTEKLVAIATATLFISIGLAVAESNCGQLEERLLYNTKTETEPTEYIWIGLLARLNGNRTFKTECNVILIGMQHVLTPATCVRPFNNDPTKVAAILGIWKQNHDPRKKYECNEKGFCVFAPVQHEVAEIIVHPYMDRHTGDNNIAIMKLKKPVTITGYLQPICLQPKVQLKSLTDRNFQYAGFVKDFGPNKYKGDTFVVSRSMCNNRKTSPVPPPESQFCAYPEKRTNFYHGSAIMGVNIENDVPKSFYLIGMLVNIHTIQVSSTTMLIFQDLRPSMSWILDKINEQSTDLGEDRFDIRKA